MEYINVNTDRVELIPMIIGRLAPIVVTEIDKYDKIKKLEKVLTELGPHVVLNDYSTPRQLFEFLSQHRNDLVVVHSDIFTKRKNYLDIMMGAVCSSPDSGSLWTVSYLNEKAFKFKGKIIMCTTKTRDEITANKRFMYFSRDCSFV